MLRYRHYIVLLIAGLTAMGASAQNPNVLLNPGFESGTSPWTFYTNGTGSFASVTPGFTGSRAGRITIATTGSNIQLYQSALPLEPNTRYTLTFTAYASTGRDLSVSVLKQVTPFTNYGLSNRIFNLTTGWQTFTTQFTTTGFTSPVYDGRLRFWFASLAAAGEVYYIDDAQLQKTVVTPLPPTITQEPQTRTVGEGQSAPFAVAASGTSPFSYQWFRNGQAIPGATSASYTTPPAVRADSGTAFRCIVSNALGADTSRTAFLLVSPPLSVSIWYGRQQKFGHIGDPVPAVNVLGSVFAANGLASLTYSLNGGSQVNLSRGPDTRRLRDKGDFNIDIPFVTLQSGINRIIMRAVDSINTVVLDTVSLAYAAGNSWPLPYQINWSMAGALQNVAQVLDGLWSVDSIAGVLRPIQLGYDRLVAIGEQTWQDYEITAPITIHRIDSSGFAPPSSGAGIGFLLRWPGHSDLPLAVAGWQPKTGYLPLGALAWYNYRSDGQRLMITGNNLQTLAQETNGRRLTHGIRYIFKARVETIAGVGGRYRIKVWQDGLPEPAGWDLTGQDELTDPQQGCVLLIAHNVDASFGNVSVVPLGVPTYILTVNTAGSGSVSRSPDQSTYAQGEVVTLTGVAASGWQFQSWAGDLTGTSNPATITMTANKTVTATFTRVIPPGTLVSDEFNSPSLNTSVWTFVNPLSDATLSMTGSQLSIAIPAGTSHDVWTGGNFAPRVVQATNNTDFEVEARFQSAMTGRYQIQGLIVEQDPDDFIRFDFVRDATRTRIFAATFLGGVPTIRKDSVIASASSLILRVRRKGTQWTQRFASGSIWSTAAVFSHPLIVNSVGPFFGTAGSPSPGFIGVVDYFHTFAATAGPDPPAARTPKDPAGEDIPARFALKQNYPNPFNGETKIGYWVSGIGSGSWVTLRVYDVLGREVARLVDGLVSPGEYSVMFSAKSGSASGRDASNLASGVYLYRMQAASASGEIFTATGRMILLR